MPTKRTGLAIAAIAAASLATCAWALAPQRADRAPEKSETIAQGSLPKAASGAAARARQKTLLQLRNAARNGTMLAGQQLGLGWQAADKYATYVEGLAATASGSPAVVGVDYGWDAMDPAQIRLANVQLARHWARGGLGAVIFSPANPFNGKGAYDREGVDFAELLKESSAPNLRLKKDLDAVAEGLRELRDAGIPVVFRPYQEPNGPWFWWCPAGRGGSEADRAGYVALYRETRRYLTQEKGLDNVIFAWAANHRGRWGEVEPVDRYYPGDDAVDLVGLDLYNDLWDDAGLAGGADCALAAKTGKPLVWEVGPQALDDGSFDARKVVAALKKYCPTTAYFLFWNGWETKGPLGTTTGYRKKALAEVSYAREVLADPKVMTLEKWNRQKKKPSK